MLRLSFISRTTRLSRKIKQSRILGLYLNSNINEQVIIRFNSSKNNDINDQIDPLDINSLIPDLPNENILANKSTKDGTISDPSNKIINEGNVTNNDVKSSEMLSDINSLEVENKDSDQQKDKQNEDNSFDILNNFITEEYNNSKESKQVEFDELLAALNIGNEFSSTEPDIERLSKLTEDQIEAKSNETDNDEEFKPVDIDKNDENIFDLDFLEMANHKESSSKIIEEEKQLFQNIFNSYMQPMEDEAKAEKELLWNLRDSVKLSKSKIDNILESRTNRYNLTNVSDRLKDELFTKTKVALLPTIKYIDELNSVSSLVEYFKKVFNGWYKQVEISSEKKSIYEDIYLNKLLKNSKKFSAKHEKFINSIQAQSNEQPELPILNMFTLPIIFNAVLHNLTFKYYDGQLALSLFNILKKDISLYTIVCNQRTYNEILRIQWIYNGKSNLYGIEMIYIEMLNNGFTGDIVTFNILKQIIIDYHNLKMGKSQLNKHTCLPIWSKEDDKRIESLERKLSNLANTLRQLHI